MTIPVLGDRAGMSSAATGTGSTITLEAALGAVAPNVCSFQDFGTAGITNGQPVSYLILDSNGNWEVGVATFSTSGPSLTGRTPTGSSNAGAAINLSGNQQVFIAALTANIMTNFLTGAGLKGGPIQNAGTVLADPAYHQSFLAGLQLSNDVTTPNSVLDISSGVCVDSTNASFIKLANFTKSTAGSWVAGSGNDAMGNGLTIAASTWYHVFAAIISGAADIFFDTSVTAANKPTGTTYFRRIGSFMTDGSAHIMAFTQNGDTFIWSTPQLAYAAGAPTSLTLETMAFIPTGVIVTALLDGIIENASALVSFVLQTSANITSGSVVAVTQVGAANLGLGLLTLQTANTSAQLYMFANAFSTSVDLFAKGWIDRRGRDN
jgi:hypothetical protein